LPVLTSEDEGNLRDIAPFIAMALENNEGTMREKMAVSNGEVDGQVVRALREVVRLFDDGESLNGLM
jgi:hypothetical protein